jgi:hypothetical protein
VKVQLLYFNALNTELNLICHLLALLGVHHFLHVCRIRVKDLQMGFTQASMPDLLGEQQRVSLADNYGGNKIGNV